MSIPALVMIAVFAPIGDLVWRQLLPGREPDASGDGSPVLEMRRVKIDLSAHCREHPASVSPGAAGHSAGWMKSELGSPLPTHKLVRRLMLRGLSRLILSTGSHRVFFAHRAGARRTLCDARSRYRTRSARRCT